MINLSFKIYVHRSGRSVRGMSAQGTSIALCSPGENHFYTKIRNTLGKGNSQCFIQFVCFFFQFSIQVVNI